MTGDVEEGGQVTKEGGQVTNAVSPRRAADADFATSSLVELCVL